MKNFLTGLFTIIATFLTPIKGLLLILVGFIILDTIVGIYTSIKLNGRKSFTSNRLFNVVVKSFFYQSTVILAFVVDKFILSSILFGIPYLMSKAVCVFWIYIEIKSLDEKSVRLGNKSFWILIKEAIKKIMSIKKDIQEIGK